jgi:hypothetical protein
MFHYGIRAVFVNMGRLQNGIKAVFVNMGRLQYGMRAQFSTVNLDGTS